MEEQKPTRTSAATAASLAARRERRTQRLLDELTDGGRNLERLAEELRVAGWTVEEPRDDQG